MEDEATFPNETFLRDRLSCMGTGSIVMKNDSLSSEYEGSSFKLKSPLQKQANDLLQFLLFNVSSL